MLAWALTACSEASVGKVGGVAGRSAPASSAWCSASCTSTASAWAAKANSVQARASDFMADSRSILAQLQSKRRADRGIAWLAAQIGGKSVEAEHLGVRAGTR